MASDAVAAAAGEEVARSRTCHNVVDTRRTVAGPVHCGKLLDLAPPEAGEEEVVGGRSDESRAAGKVFAARAEDAETQPLRPAESEGSHARVVAGSDMEETIVVEHYRSRSPIDSLVVENTPVDPVTLVGGSSFRGLPSYYCRLRRCCCCDCGGEFVLAENDPCHVCPLIECLSSHGVREHYHHRRRRRSGSLRPSVVPPFSCSRVWNGSVSSPSVPVRRR